MTDKTKPTPDTASDPTKAIEGFREVIAPQRTKPVMVLESVDGTHRFDKDRIVIGSVVSADLRIGGEGVAPLHAVIEHGEDGRVTVFDLASETGVFVNGKKTVLEVLAEGAKITLGRYSFKFSLDKPPSANVLPPPSREAEGRKLFLDPKEDFTSLLLEDSSKVQDIFDYRPTQKQALEVVYSWNIAGSDGVLDVQHFVDAERVCIGPTREADFGIPPLLPQLSAQGSFDLVTRVGKDYVLNLDVPMKGVVHRNGQLQNLDQLKQAYQVTLGKDDFAKITLGPLDFYLSFTAAPPRLKPSKMIERDPLFFKIFGASCLLSVVLITALLKINVPQYVDVEQVPERIATILYRPEKFSAKKPVLLKEPPPPLEKIALELKAADPNKAVPKEMQVANKRDEQSAPATKKNAKPKGQHKAKEGQGARAKGKEGERGSKTSKRDLEKQEQAMRAAPGGGEGKGGGNSKVADEGNLDLLKSAAGKIQNLLGNSAAQLGKSGSKLKGFGGFDTGGGGGLALSGAGKGGGGTDATTLGGLSNEGRGGARVGTGMGAAGTGSGIVGGQTRVAIRMGGDEETVVMGAIDREAVEAAILAHRDEFRLCYEKEINAENPHLAGRVGTSFVIGASGSVTQAGLESTTLNNANTERCILGVLKRIQFPIPRGAGIVQVSYAFKYSSGGK
ncbi:AgmX/PglI C-terminal domain-containing protein [Bdellovibrionota bacterium FG-2]